MRDPITIITCAIGAAALWFYGLPTAGEGEGAGWQAIEAALGLGIGGWGLSRATGSRGLRVVSVVMMMAALIPLLPSAIPQMLVEERSIRDLVANVVISFARVALVAAVVISLFAIRARVGGIVFLSIVGLVVGLLARGVAGVGDGGEQSMSEVHALAQVISLGLSRPAREIAAISWVLAAFVPITTAGRASSGARGALFAGAVGCFLLLASFEAVQWSHRFGAVGTALTMALGWILAAVGLAGLARSGGAPAAWAAIALVVIELVVCPVSMFVGEHALGRDFTVILLPSSFGLAGIAIALLGARDVPFTSVRRVAGVLLIVATLGSCLATSGTLASVDAIGLRLESPFWGIHKLMIPASHLALLAWAAMQAYLGAPPATVLPDGEAPAPSLAVAP